MALVVPKQKKLAAAALPRKITGADLKRVKIKRGANGLSKSQKS